MKALPPHIFPSKLQYKILLLVNTCPPGHAQQQKLLVSSACIIGNVRTKTVPRISGKGGRRKCYFGCCCPQGPDAEQVEQRTVSCEDVGLGEPVEEEV